MRLRDELVSPGGGRLHDRSRAQALQVTEETDGGT